MTKPLMEWQPMSSDKGPAWVVRLSPHSPTAAPYVVVVKQASDHADALSKALEYARTKYGDGMGYINPSGPHQVELTHYVVS